MGKSKELHEYEDTCTVILQAQKNKYGIKEPISGQVQAYFQFDFKGYCRADVDNLLGQIFDLLQKSGILLNDKQITVGSFRVRDYVSSDQTLVLIEEL